MPSAADKKLHFNVQQQMHDYPVVNLPGAITWATTADGKFIHMRDYFLG
jgi:hypothetical protein